MVVEPTPCPDGWLGNSEFVALHMCCNNVDYFCSDVVELAEKLVGQCLYCHENRIVVRILETEAYPEADDAEVHEELFGSPSPFKLVGGQIISCKREGHHLVETNRGNSTTASTPDVEKNLLIGPENFARGLGRGWESSTGPGERPHLLYEETGLQLYLADPNEERKMSCGTRQLPASHSDERSFALL